MRTTNDQTDGIENPSVEDLARAPFISKQNLKSISGFARVTSKVAIFRNLKSTGPAEKVTYFSKHRSAKCQRGTAGRADLICNSISFL